MEPASSWIIVRFVNHGAGTGSPKAIFFFLTSLSLGKLGIRNTYLEEL